RAERLGLTFRGGLGVALEGVTISDDPAFDAAEPFLTARRLGMRLSLLPLLRRRLVVDRVVVDEPVVRLVRDRAGRLNVSTLGHPERDSESAADASRRHGRPAFQLAALRLRHGTLSYTDRATGRGVELTDVAVDAHEPRFGAPMPIAVRAQLAGADLRLEDIVSQGMLDLAGARPAYQGTVTAGRGMLGSLPLARVRATIHASPPDLALDSATIELLGGSATGNARLTASALEAHIAGRGIDLARVPARPGAPHPAGALELEAALAGPAPGTEGFRSALTGRGRFRVAHVRGAGDLGLDGDADVSVRLVASPALTDDLLGRSRMRPVLVDDGGRLGIPLHVRGPLHHPRVTPEPAFAASVTRGLLGGTGLEEKAGSLVERLFGGKRRRER